MKLHALFRIIENSKKYVPKRGETEFSLVQKFSIRCPGHLLIGVVLGGVGRDNCRIAQPKRVEGMMWPDLL